MYRDSPPAPDKLRAERAALVLRRVDLFAQRELLKSNVRLGSKAEPRPDCRTALIALSPDSSLRLPGY